MSNIYRKVNDEIIFGRSLPVLVRDRDGQYILTDLEVYRDGRIICWGIDDLSLRNIIELSPFPEMSLEQFIEIVSLGAFVTTVPEGESITVANLATFTVSKIESLLEQDDLIRVVRDTLHELNGEPTSSDRCREAFFRFLDAPTRFNHERLREAYQAVRPIGKYLFSRILTMEMQRLQRFWSGRLTRLIEGGSMSRSNGMSICAHSMEKSLGRKNVIWQIFYTSR